MNQFSPYSQPMMNNPYQNGYSPMLSQQQRLMQMEQQYAQQNQFVQPAQTFGASQVQSVGIQGKIVSDFETVKSTEIPLDGSISYFPTANGEYVYSKFLNMNTGSSDYGVYRRITDETQMESREEFDIKTYFDEKFESLKQELKGGTKNARKSNNKPDNEKADEQRL